MAGSDMKLIEETHCILACSAILFLSHSLLILTLESEKMKSRAAAELAGRASTDADTWKGASALCVTWASVGWRRLVCKQIDFLKM